MALPFPIAASQTDAKSPIDQQLMDAIRLNQEYLETQVGAGGGTGGPIMFKANGALWAIKPLLSLGHGKKIDGAVVSTATTFTRARLYLKTGGLSGSCEVDVNRHINVNHPINSIIPQYEGITQSIGRLGVAQNTQSVSIATPVINTQQIILGKAAVNIKSIVPVDTPNGSRWLITFTGTVVLDGDYEQNDYAIISGATNAANDGEFQIEQINYDGLPSIVVNNPSGVLQSAPAGTGQLALYQYDYLAAIDDDIIADEEIIMAGHTDGASNGTFTVFKTNQGGNNIWLKYAAGVTQGGVAGTATCTRWVYSFAGALDDTQYIVGEKAQPSGHTSAANDGKFTIRRVNEAGNNIYLTNNAGVSQAGAAGVMDTLRWLYATPIDSSADVTVGDTIEANGHTNILNDGEFEVKFINRFAANNLEIFNENGVAQAGIAGTLENALKIVTFETDLSAEYLIDKSKVLLEGISTAADNVVDEFTVKEINRGIGLFNIVILGNGLTKQDGAAGRVATEARSIFIIKPIVTVAEDNRVRNYETDDGATFEVGAIPAESIVTMDVTQIQGGLPEGLTLNLS